MLGHSRGRGRGRSRTKPFCDSENGFSYSAPHITAEKPPSLTFITIADNRSESGISSGSISPTSSEGPHTYSYKGRGRASNLRRDIAPHDPYWTVTNLTQAQFHTHERPKKPDELGALGNEIKVIANHFPILQFPQRGLVYKYQIQIRNRKDFEIHRERRR